MADHELTLEEVRMMAADIGMNGLNEAHLQQLLRATKAARARRDSLSMTGLTPADEPAHVYRLNPEGKS